MSDHGDFRQKIDQAKVRLPLPDLMAKEGLAEHAKKSARCPFPGHEDKHPSFSVFHSEDGKGWQWKCFARCGEGDEITFLAKLRGISLTKAMNVYLEMAGFPSTPSSKSHEYPKYRECPKCPESPAFPESREYPVSPVSNGQELNGKIEKELKELAARNACKECNTVRSRRWQLARDVRGIEKRIGRELTKPELKQVLYEWHRVSLPFLDPGETRDDHLAMFLAELLKVRVPTGQGDPVKQSLERVSKLSASDLPLIPGHADAPESWRRLAALHREMRRLSMRKNKTYFLTYRDAAKVCDGLSHQSAYAITLALTQFGMIKIVHRGKTGAISGKAAEFRYLVSKPRRKHTVYRSV